MGRKQAGPRNVVGGRQSAPEGLRPRLYPAGAILVLGVPVVFQALSLRSDQPGACPGSQRNTIHRPRGQHWELPWGVDPPGQDSLGLSTRPPSLRSHV